MSRSSITRQPITVGRLGFRRLAQSLFALSVVSTVALGAVEGRTTSAAQARVIGQNSITIAQATDEFVDVDHVTTGTIEILTNTNGDRTLRLNNFSTDNGPALEVILYEHAVVPTNIEGKGTYISLGELTRIEGTQDYVIPADIDLAQFNAVGIWCEQFDVTFGYAPLN